MLYALKLLAGIGALVALVPLLVWAGSGSWKHAWFALRQYSAIVGGAAAVVALLALALTVSELIDRLP